MEVKPGYKQTEVGVIPDEWEVFPLSEMTEPSRPISYGIVQTGPNVANGVRCLRVIDINEGRINNTELITTSRQISDTYRRTVLKAGDLVMPLRGKVGDVGLVDEELGGSNLTRGIALIAIRSGWLPVFCQQVISSSSTRKRLGQAMNGSALQEIPIVSLRSFKIATPKSLSEQRAIATALSDVGGLLGGLDRLIAKKRDVKQAVMQQLLTGQTRLPGFLGEWEVKAIRNLGSIQTGPFGTLLKAHEYSGSEGVPLISVGEVGAGRLRITEDTPRVPKKVIRRLPQYVLRKGDIVFGRKGAVDRSALISEAEDGWFLGSDGIRLRPQEGCHPPYLAWQFQRYDVQAWLLQNAIGTTMASLNQGILNRVQIPCAPLPEQAAIAEVLTDMDAELAALEQRREKTRALKQAMMQELLTGRTRLVPPKEAHA